MKKIPFELPKRPPVRPTQSWAGIVPVLFRSRAAGYTIVNSELTTYTTGLTTELPETQLTRLDTFITALKTGLSITNLSDAFDVMYILAGETEESSLKNLVKNAHHCTNVHATAWTQYEGFTGDGANDYLDTNYNPTNHGARYSQNNASMGIYTRTDRIGSNAKVIMGVLSGGIYNYLFARSASTNLVRGVLNQTSTTFAATATSNTLGFSSVHRYSANSIMSAKNKTLGADSGIASAGINNANIFILARNNAGSADVFDDIQASFAWLGRSLSQADLNSVVDSFEAYMDANGKGVVA